MLDTTLNSRRGKPRLAIVSTYDDLCGIAGYTRALTKQLEPHFDIEVFDLEQFFMRSTDIRVRRLADGMIKEFCDRANNFDFVNIQLEHGTLGKNISDIVRRFSMIARSAPALSVTFHTILPQETFNTDLFGRHLRRLRIGAASGVVLNYIASKYLNGRIYGVLQRLQLKKPVNVIVHTRRDMRLMKYVNSFKSVFDHPLAFIGPDTAESLRREAKLRPLHGLGELPPGSTIIGVFGFLSEYKGVDTVIRALHLLPSNYHLLIFGGLHPNEIKKGVELHPYVEHLLETANVGTTALDAAGKKQIIFQLDSASANLLIEHPKNIGQRIHFLGPQTDEGFAAGMAVCDHVVLPYREVGQSSSGVLSIAVEMGSRVIAARNHAFIQFCRYHPDRIELFEVGNFLELAEKIRAVPAYLPTAQEPRFSIHTNTQVYIAANSRGGTPWEVDRPVVVEEDRKVESL